MEDEVTIVVNKEKGGESVVTRKETEDMYNDKFNRESALVAVTPQQSCK